ncbi:putative F-box protein At3g58860 isoform X2 [Prunus persica]|uniref:putative F-box protein At3g58860 isoform X2 n=1 Tax=Prunus persica TaxID=3760 RepID=UPI0009AB2FF3|nr:putative F-box protein At3g58860 isoform X2 [Prunus persica]
METDPPKQTKATDKETDPPKQTKATDKETDPPKQSKATDMETNPPKQAKATDKETHPPKQSKATDMETNPPKQAKAMDVETDPPKQTIASSQDHLLQVPISSEQVRANWMHDLPMHLLESILSDLPVKESVCTSCMCKSWHDNLWSFVSADDTSKSTESDFKKSLEKLLQNPAYFLNVRLRCTKFKRHSFLHEFLRELLKKKVINLEIAVDRHESLGFFPIPPEVFTSMHLWVLKIASARIILSPPGTFTRLSAIQVDVSRSSHASILDFYKWCPVLQDLQIQGKIMRLPDKKQKFQIRSQSLLRLKITLHLHKLQLDRGQKVYLSAGNLYEVDIDAPQLEVLDIDESIFAKFKIGNFKHLREVKLQSGFYEAKRQLGEVGELLVLSRGVFYTINQASLSTSCLVVGDGAFGALSFTFMDYLLSGNEAAIRNKFRMTFPDFYHVTSLRLCIADSSGWLFMPYLLAHLPNLQRLDLEVVDREEVRKGKKFKWNPPKDHVGWCLTSVKHVRMIGFGEMMEEASRILDFVREAATEERFEEITITYE